MDGYSTARRTDSESPQRTRASIHPESSDAAGLVVADDSTCGPRNRAFYSTRLLRVSRNARPMPRRTGQSTTSVFAVGSPTRPGTPPWTVRNPDAGALAAGGDSPASHRSSRSTPRTTRARREEGGDRQDVTPLRDTPSAVPCGGSGLRQARGVARASRGATRRQLDCHHGLRGPRGTGLPLYFPEQAADGTHSVPGSGIRVGIDGARDDRGAHHLESHTPKPESQER